MHESEQMGVLSHPPALETIGADRLERRDSLKNTCFERKPNAMCCKKNM
jgi:hypothetical protein